MSTYFADENTKQIAVRKVFGADVNSETWRAVNRRQAILRVCEIAGRHVIIRTRPVLKGAESELYDAGRRFCVLAK
jgi:hypothetical protein